MSKKPSLIKCGLLLQLKLLVNVSNTISQQDFEPTLQAIEGLTQESHMHNKDLINNKKWQGCGLLNMSQLGYNFLLNKNKRGGKGLVMTFFILQNKIL